MSAQREPTIVASRRAVLRGAGALAAAFGPVGSAALAQTGLLSPANFRPYLWKDFTVVADGGVTAAFTLTSVTLEPRDRRPAGLPSPFSLIFQSNVAGLPSGLYEVRMPNGTRLALFLSPIRQSGNFYEAAFN